MRKHTPGPWRILPTRNHLYQRFVKPGDFEECMQSWRYLCGPEHDSNFVADIVTEVGDAGDANARLIAAAPELLEALRGIAAMATQSVNSEHWPEVGIQIEKAARLAIAKAEGRAS